MNNKNLILKKQTLVNIADAVRAKTGSTDLIAIEDLDDAVANLQIGEGGSGGGIIEVDVLPELMISNPGPVPSATFSVDKETGDWNLISNSETCDKIYLNTSLNVEKTIAEIKKVTQDLDAIYGHEMSAYQYYMYGGNENADIFYLYVYNYFNEDADGNYTGYSDRWCIDLVLYDNNTGDCIYDNCVFDSSNGGWDPEFSGVIDTSDTTMIISYVEWNNSIDWGDNYGVDPYIKNGVVNMSDSIANLIYASVMVVNPELEENVYKIKKRPVPVQGEVKNIYFNSNLSVLEVNSILSTLDYDYKDNTAYIVAGVGGRTIEVWRTDDYYEIQESAGSAGWFEIFNSEEGWVHPYLSEFIYDGVVLEPIHWGEFYCGLQNEKLKELISIDDFYIDFSVSGCNGYTHLLAAKDLTIKNIETDDYMYINALPDCKNLVIDGYRGFVQNYALQKEIAPNDSITVFAAGVVGIMDDYGKDIQCIKNCYSIHVDDEDNTHDGLTLVILTGRDALVHIKNMEM